MNSFDSWFADIIPLKESPSNNIFVVDRNTKAEYLTVKTIAPVKYAYLRNEDGYRVYFNKTMNLNILNENNLDLKNENLNVETVNNNDNKENSKNKIKIF